MEMTDEKQRALRALCGFALRYGRRQIDGRDYDIFCSQLRIDSATIYGLEFNFMGFTYTTRAFVLRYRHDDSHEKRIAQLQEQ
jgi:hypothetical protein